MKYSTNKPLLILLLLATLIPTLYFVFVFTQFEYLAKQDWFYSEVFWGAKSIYMVSLVAVYIYLAKINVLLAKEHKAKWYIAILFIPYIAAPLFWFKYAWPAANNTSNLTGADNAPSS